MSIPAHKVIGNVGKPGQWVNPDVTLGDYLARKKRYDALDTVALENVNKVKKLTFEDWAVSLGYGYWYAPGKMQWSAWTRLSEGEVRSIWKAAQENV